ncbi:RNA-directed DNA polymerase protein [Dioscorea alata]|uniref:RNA-directed DNA polymerase protein n=1 Tax=Dioscorea alata TaxID=55571 RepID=A0ACB7UA29_DIOAL|nr:RNA-directed DNA polymerase protein [Dioscorea alata]
MREVFSEVRMEENRKKIMCSAGDGVRADSSALVVRGSDQGPEQRRKPFCDYCKRPWHTREQCWKLHGRPPNGKTRSNKTAIHTTADTLSTPSHSTLTPVQIEQLLKLFPPASDSSLNPTCSMTTSGTSLSNSLLVSSLLCSRSNLIWIIDSGASDHMTSNFSLFCSYRPCAGNRSVNIAGGSFSVIAGVGDIKIPSALTLTNVLHVPSFSCNLISVAKLTSNLQCSVFFSVSGCVFQD